jgi:hypothetical protein
MSPDRILYHGSRGGIIGYALSVDYSHVAREQVLVIVRYEWVYVILHFRRACRPFRGSRIDVRRPRTRAAA